MFRPVFIGLLVLVFSAGAIAAQEREPTKQELAESDAKLERTKREEPKKFRELVTMAQVALGSFGFGVGPFDGTIDPRTIAALRKHQQVRGIPANGRLDARTIHHLFKDFTVSRKNTSILLPPKSVFATTWDSGYVKATGTWTIVGEGSARPVQTSDIVCSRERRVCFEATTFFDLENNYLHSSAEIYDIDRWDQHEITTRPLTSSLCVRYPMRIGRLQESVTGLRLRINDDGMCKDLTPELHLKLVNGMDVMRDVVKVNAAKLKGVFQGSSLGKE